MAAAEGCHAWKMFVGQVGRLRLFPSGGRPSFAAPDASSRTGSHCWLQGVVVWTCSEAVVIDDGTGLCLLDLELMNANTTLGCAALGCEVLAIGAPVYTTQSRTPFLKRCRERLGGRELEALAIDVVLKASKVAPLAEPLASSLWIAEVLALQRKLYPQP